MRQRMRIAALPVALAGILAAGSAPAQDVGERLNRAWEGFQGEPQRRDQDTRSRDGYRDDDRRRSRDGYDRSGSDRQRSLDADERRLVEDQRRLDAERRRLEDERRRGERSR